MGRAALIADQVGELYVASRVRNNLKKWLNPVLEGRNENRFVYDNSWGGLVTIQGACGKAHATVFYVLRRPCAWRLSNDSTKTLSDL